MWQGSLPETIKSNIVFANQNGPNTAPPQPPALRVGSNRLFQNSLMCNTSRQIPSSERQYKSRTWKRRLGPTRRAGWFCNNAQCQLLPAPRIRGAVKVNQRSARALFGRAQPRRGWCGRGARRRSLPGPFGPQSNGNFLGKRGQFSPKDDNTGQRTDPAASRATPRLTWTSARVGATPSAPRYSDIALRKVSRLSVSARRLSTRGEQHARGRGRALALHGVPRS